MALQACRHGPRLVSSAEQVAGSELCLGVSASGPSAPIDPYPYFNCEHDEVGSRSVQNDS